MRSPTGPTRRAFGPILAAAIVLAGGAYLLISSTPARAAQDSSGFPSITFESYVLGGQTTQLGCSGTNCPAVPPGATVDIRVWVDLYMCDPVTIFFGAAGAGSQTTNFNGAFSRDFQHTYTAAGIYPVKVVASDCNGGSFDHTAPLNVANSPAGGLGLGSLPGLDGPLGVPAMLALFLGFIALILAITAGVVGPAGAAGAGVGRGMKLPPSAGGGPTATDPTVPKPFVQPRLTGIPYSMSLHVASLFDIPVGAQRIDPGRIPFRPGTPTDIWQAPQCPVAGCGELVYTAAGWFSPNPNCPLRNHDANLTAFPTVGQHYVGTAVAGQ